MLRTAESDALHRLTRKGLHDRMQLQDKSLRRSSVALSVSFTAAGLLAYVLMAVAKRSMSPGDFSNFSVFWSLGFFLTASVGFPIEQELTRSVSYREAHGQRFDDVVRSAVALAAVLAGVAVLFAVGAGMSGVLKGFQFNTAAAAALVLLIAGEAMTSIIRGVLSGTRSTSALAGLVAGQSALRTALVIGAVAINADGGFAALAVAVSSLTCVVFLRRAWRMRTQDRAPADTSGLSHGGILRLVVASPFSAVFSVGTPALASLVAARSERAIIGDVFAALSLTSAPVLVAAALQTALLPALVRSLLEGGPEALHRTTRTIITVVIGLSGVAATVTAVVGPMLLRLLFGPTPGVGRLPLAAMTFAAGLLFLTNLLAPVCIARRSHGAVTRAWASGAITMVCLMLIPGQLANRVAIALLGGACVVSGSLVVSLRAVWRPSATVDPGTKSAIIS